MKKLISFLTAITLTAASSSAVFACSKNNSSPKTNKVSVNVSFSSATLDDNDLKTIHLKGSNLNKLNEISKVTFVLYDPNLNPYHSAIKFDKENSSADSIDVVLDKPIPKHGFGEYTLRVSCQDDAPVGGITSEIKVKYNEFQEELSSAEYDQKNGIIKIKGNHLNQIDQDDLGKFELTSQIKGIDIPKNEKLSIVEETQTSSYLELKLSENIVSYGDYKISYTGATSKKAETSFSFRGEDVQFYDADFNIDGNPRIITLKGFNLKKINDPKQIYIGGIGFDPTPYNSNDPFHPNDWDGELSWKIDELGDGTDSQIDINLNNKLEKTGDYLVAFGEELKISKQHIDDGTDKGTDVDYPDPASIQWKNTFSIRKNPTFAGAVYSNNQGSMFNDGPIITISGKDLDTVNDATKLKLFSVTLPADPNKKYPEVKGIKLSIKKLVQTPFGTTLIIGLSKGLSDGKSYNIAYYVDDKIVAQTPFSVRGM